MPRRKKNQPPRELKKVASASDKPAEARKAIIDEIVEANSSKSKWNMAVTPAHAESVLARVSMGSTLKQACEDIGVSTAQFLQKCRYDPAIKEMYRTARETQADMYVDRLMDATFSEEVSPAKLTAMRGAIEFFAKSHFRQQYGDKVQIDQRSVTINIDKDSGWDAEPNDPAQPVIDYEPDDQPPTD